MKYTPLSNRVRLTVCFVDLNVSVRIILPALSVTTNPVPNNSAPMDNVTSSFVGLGCTEISDSISSIPVKSTSRHSEVLLQGSVASVYFFAFLYEKWNQIKN